MKQSFFKYSLPFMLTLLCGLCFVHSNLKLEDSIKLDSKETFSQFKDVDQQAQVAINTLSSDKKLAIEVAETEEQEEEVRHSDSSKENNKQLANITYSFLLLSHILWSFLYRSKKSNALSSALEATLPFRRYIRYQVFRL
ncbi:hypothetical protein DZC72_02975 [Maribacter algicola]|uniref:Uncharacterized protein n=1 Tax=Maribacter algicola TaxID=2498892 RepID=A0A426RKR5_9FLAO|nr:hypothetical protein [Maribacter algicola]RRQ49581.1 hypothetical protein DZC72_02975 [Maribacter algicola]